MTDEAFQLKVVKRGGFTVEPSWVNGLLLASHKPELLLSAKGVTNILMAY